MPKKKPWRTKEGQTQEGLYLWHHEVRTKAMNPIVQMGYYPDAGMYTAHSYIPGKPFKVMFRTFMGNTAKIPYEHTGGSIEVKSPMKSTNTAPGAV